MKHVVGTANVTLTDLAAWERYGAVLSAWTDIPAEHAARFLFTFKGGQVIEETVPYGDIDTLEGRESPLQVALRRARWKVDRKRRATPENAHSVLELLKANGATSIFVTGGEVWGATEASGAGMTSIDDPDALRQVLETIRDVGATYEWVRAVVTRPDWWETERSLPGYKNPAWKGK